MIFSPHQLASALMEMSAEGMSSAQIVSGVVGFLKKKKKLHWLPLVTSEVIALHNAKQCIAPVSIVSAFSLSDSQKAEAEKKAIALFPDKKLEITYSEDSSLLGGLVISSLGKVWNASVRSSLQKLKNSL